MLSPDQITALAPDAASLKAGRNLASQRKWAAAGADENALWGLAIGSGKSLYQTAIALDDFASKCSCPSRKFPCKHALGLMLMAANAPADLDESAAPPWVIGWLEKRAGRAEKVPAAKPTAADPQAAAARRERREDRMAAGVEILGQTLLDLTRGGLASGPARGRLAWENLARRMVDAQAPGLAAELRRISASVLADPDADTLLPLEIGRLHLLVEAFRTLDSRGEATRAEILMRLGAGQADGGEVVADEWFVASRSVEESDRLLVSSTWLLGVKSRRWAKILRFAPAPRVPIEPWQIGANITVSLRFPPGLAPQRAIPEDDGISAPAALPDATGETLEVLLDRLAQSLAVNPFLRAIPFLIPLRPAGEMLADAAGRALPYQTSGDLPLRLDSICAGLPTPICGEWNGRHLLPLAIRDGAEWISLCPASDWPRTGFCQSNRPVTADPLLTAALLGSARISTPPPPPHPSLEAVWRGLDWENPAAAVLSGLALVRTLRLAGQRTREAAEEPTACPPDPREPLSAAASGILARLLAGEFPETLAEWTRLAMAADRPLPARHLPRLLAAATAKPAIRPAVPALAGPRGAWLARRHPGFSWLLETVPASADAWQTGLSAERIAWLLHIRAADPAAAAAEISAHWPGEDAVMREMIVRLAAADPHPCDEPWLESLALRERRQDVREFATAALAGIAGSAFLGRVVARVRACMKFRSTPLDVGPPDAFDPAWTADGIREKPPQATGEKAWWLRQIIAQLPLDQWPALTVENFPPPVAGDWQDAVLLGWLDSFRRHPARALPERLVPYFANLTPWPLALPPRESVLTALLDATPIPLRYRLLDGLAENLTPAVLLDFLVRCHQPPPLGVGNAALAVLDAAIPELFHNLTRPQARAISACVPAAEIQTRLISLSQLAELPPAAEEFAQTLEFRRDLVSHFATP